MNLNAGGAIVRAVSGLGDEENNGYNNLDVLEGMLQHAYAPFLGQVNAETGDSYDSEPDIFYFNAMGYSGKFIMRNNLPILLSPEHYKIEYLDSEGFVMPGESPFQITAPDGTRLLFEANEKTHIFKHIEKCKVLTG